MHWIRMWYKSTDTTGWYHFFWQFIPYLDYTNREKNLTNSNSGIRIIQFHAGPSSMAWRPHEKLTRACLSVHLSVTSRCSVKADKWVELRKGIWIHWTLLQTLDLNNFTTAHRPSQVLSTEFDRRGRFIAVVRVRLCKLSLVCVARIVINSPEKPCLCSWSSTAVIKYVVLLS